MTPLQRVAQAPCTLPATRAQNPLPARGHCPASKTPAVTECHLDLSSSGAASFLLTPITEHLLPAELRVFWGVESL